MEVLRFNEQIKRLKLTYGDKAYPPERIKLIFRALQSLPDSRFEALVDHFIANSRNAPMLRDFADEIQDTDKRDQSAGDGSVLALIKNAEKNNKTADREFVRVCVQSVEALMARRMSDKEFWLEVLPLLYSSTNQSHLLERDEVYQEKRKLYGVEK